MKRWAVAGVVLLVGVGGCSRTAVEAPQASERKVVRRVVVRQSTQPPAQEDEPRGKRIEELLKQVTNRRPATPTESLPPDEPNEAVLPPTATAPPPPQRSAPPAAQAPPVRSAPAVPPRGAIRLTQAQVEERLKKNLQPVFIDVSLRDLGGGRYAGTVKDTAYTDMPIRVQTDYSGTIQYEIGTPGVALSRGTITWDGRHSNNMMIPP